MKKNLLFTLIILIIPFYACNEKDTELDAELESELESIIKTVTEEENTKLSENYELLTSAKWIYDHALYAENNNNSFNSETIRFIIGENSNKNTYERVFKNGQKTETGDWIFNKEETAVVFTKKDAVTKKFIKVYKENIIKLTTDNLVLKDEEGTEHFYINEALAEIKEKENTSDILNEEETSGEKEEALKEGTITAVFKYYSQGDFEHYTFVTENGTQYTFEEMNDYAEGIEFSKLNEYGEYSENPQVVGKKFKITFHTKTIINEYDGGSEYEMGVIDKIELASK